MSIDNASPQAGTDDGYAWLREGNLPVSREDRIAEAVALIALLFSLGIGLVIALLPVSAKAAEPVAASLELSAFEIVFAASDPPSRTLLLATPPPMPLPQPGVGAAGSVEWSGR
jgi:hypothetical protein